MASGLEGASTPVGRRLRRNLAAISGRRTTCFRLSSRRRRPRRPGPLGGRAAPASPPAPRQSLSSVLALPARRAPLTPPTPPVSRPPALLRCVSSVARPPAAGLGAVQRGVGLGGRFDTRRPTAAAEPGRDQRPTHDAAARDRVRPRRRLCAPALPAGGGGRASPSPDGAASPRPADSARRRDAEEKGGTETADPGAAAIADGDDAGAAATADGGDAGSTAAGDTARLRPAGQQEGGRGCRPLATCRPGWGR